jgi:NTE family protein
MIKNKKLGLALSGGGYRAAAYHLGTLKKLNELGILDKVDVISAVSGGSILAASYGLHKGDFESFEVKFKKLLKTSIIKGIVYSSQFLLICFFSVIFILFTIYLLFTKVAWLSFVFLVIALFILAKYQFRFFPVSKINEKLYDKIFYQGATLKDLCAKPIIAINTTNLDSGRPFTFSCMKMSDSTYDYPPDGKPKVTFNPQLFPVSKAVAASTCVPFAFTPVTVSKKYFKDSDDYERVKPLLIDGGVYDNQGIHKLTHPGSSYECDILIVSDAGNMLPGVSLFKNTIGLLVRTSDVFMNRIKNFQMSLHLFNKDLPKKEIAYQSLGWDHDNCLKGYVDGVINGHVVHTTVEAHGILSEEIKGGDREAIENRLRGNLLYDGLMEQFPSEEETMLARNVSTNLTALTEGEISALSKHAETLTEIQVKLYCPSLLNIRII